tara:strand:- start:368 stop:550 length:183 start_codon:yes stop_codon:yes gene_type:complete
MEIDKLNSLYDNLIKDDDFGTLELGLNEPNIFQILRISNKEISNMTPSQSWELINKGKKK